MFSFSMQIGKGFKKKIINTSKKKILRREIMTVKTTNRLSLLFYTVYDVCFMFKEMFVFINCLPANFSIKVSNYVFGLISTFFPFLSHFIIHQFVVFLKTINSLFYLYFCLCLT